MNEFYTTSTGSYETVDPATLCLQSEPNHQACNLQSTPFGSSLDPLLPLLLILVVT